MAGSRSSHKLCTHEELPAWCHDNDFIKTGYRRPGHDDAIVNGSSGPRGSVTTSSAKTQNRNGLRSRKPQSSSSGSSEEELYRHDTVAKCWESVWGYLHNETVNIHSHLWGSVAALLFLSLHALHYLSLLPEALRPLTHHEIFLPPIMKASSTTSSTLPINSFHLPSSAALEAIDHAPNDWKDSLGFLTFLLAAITCLTLSSSFHALQCHSKRLATSMNAGDYLGIVVMIVGSFLPALHYGFYCHPHWQLFYASFITLFGSLASWTVINPQYATPQYRPYRTAIFLTLGLSAVIPVAHASSMYGFQALRWMMGLDYLMASGLFYVIGALLYALRVPERLSPGTFDFWGASHQIFHIFILFAAMSHYICLRRAYTFWHTVQVPATGGVAASFTNLLTGRSPQIGKEVVCLALESWRDVR